MYTKITISGQICTGKSTLFWGLYRHLLWPTFAASLFFRDYAKLHNASLQKAEEQSNSLTKEIDEGMRTLLKTRDRIIVEGWMAGIMAKGIDGVLKVLLTCERHEQYRRYAQREQVSIDQARKNIFEREKNLFSTLTNIHGISGFVDSKHYDVVIDTATYNQDKTLQHVLGYIKS